MEQCSRLRVKFSQYLVPVPQIDHWVKWRIFLKCTRHRHGMNWFSILLAILIAHEPLSSEWGISGPKLLEARELYQPNCFPVPPHVVTLGYYTFDEVTQTSVKWTSVSTPHPSPMQIPINSGQLFSAFLKQLLTGCPGIRNILMHGISSLFHDLLV